ncbi:hypothetical protein BJV74DRAFT_859878 [Russula compacta]|nr:hypothetical protein BJV74DRAFT_859878 [Russula compacta]
MVARRMGAAVMGDKGKLRNASSGDEVMWAVVLTKELWKKGVWSVFFGKSVGMMQMYGMHGSRDP